MKRNNSDTSLNDTNCSNYTISRQLTPFGYSTTSFFIHFSWIFRCFFFLFFKRCFFFLFCFSLNFFLIVFPFSICYFKIFILYFFSVIFFRLISFFFVHFLLFVCLSVLGFFRIFSTSSNNDIVYLSFPIFTLFPVFFFNFSVFLDYIPLHAFHSCLCFFRYFSQFRVSSSPAFLFFVLFLFLSSLNVSFRVF